MRGIFFIRSRLLWQVEIYSVFRFSTSCTWHSMIIGGDRYALFNTYIYNRRAAVSLLWKFEWYYVSYTISQLHALFCDNWPVSLCWRWTLTEIQLCPHVTKRYTLKYVLSGNVVRCSSSSSQRAKNIKRTLCSPKKIDNVSRVLAHIHTSLATFSFMLYFRLWSQTYLDAACPNL